MAGYDRRRRIEHNDNAWLAWHVATLHRAKKLPKMDTLLAKSPRRQTWQQQMALMQAWSADVKAAEARKGK